MCNPTREVTVGRGRRQQADGAGRVAVVTGAASGIGAAIARALLADGWAVLATRMPDQLPEPGMQRAQFIEVDLLDDDAPRLIAERTRQVGGAQLFVSSAGISLPGPVELRADDLSSEFEINAAAPARVAAALLPQLRHAGGRIVVIGAGQGRVALPFGGGYAASKAGLAAIVDALRAEVAGDSISVSLIEPGAVRTRILDSSREQAVSLLANATPEQRRRYEAGLMRTLEGAAGAFEQALPPERIANLVVGITHSRSPRPGYVVGREAWALAVLAHLPASWRARLVGRIARGRPAVDDTETELQRSSLS
ncbi:MAG: SDR family NAD(P)-dependent oxidoreductase [Brooklawnia sp.]